MASDEPELVLPPSVWLSVQANGPGPVSMSALADEVDEMAARPKRPPTHAGAPAKEVPSVPVLAQYCVATVPVPVATKL